jgi:hypothetical protein
MITNRGTLASLARHQADRAKLEESIEALERRYPSLPAEAATHARLNAWRRDVAMLNAVIRTDQELLDASGS